MDNIMDISFRLSRELVLVVILYIVVLILGLHKHLFLPCCFFFHLVETSTFVDTIIVIFQMVHGVTFNSNA